jgi:hypothetical protein
MAKAHATPKPITAGEALYALDRLIKERRLKASEVARLVADMHREIEELERRLAALREATGDVRTSHPRGSKEGRERPMPTGRHRRQVAPELAKSRRLQGEYMGLIRHMQGPARARMKKLAADQGREAAIRAMRVSLTK